MELTPGNSAENSIIFEILLFSIMDIPPHEETQKILLAETREEYIFETIDPPVKPEIKTAPKRALIVIISTMLGGLFSLFAVLVRHVSKNASNSLAQRE